MQSKKKVILITTIALAVIAIVFVVWFLVLRDDTVDLRNATRDNQTRATRTIEIVDAFLDGRMTATEARSGIEELGTADSGTTADIGVGSRLLGIRLTLSSYIREGPIPHRADILDLRNELARGLRQPRR